ncbi:hypothetical protein CgunFtcFv8_010574 [Champsocephalus gunnari]|uniref:RIIa domain-containing protein n=1 Tax=Champsocephalus gunnari TaxID=52237 RepID=A0AAN8DU02_CHAGU|nr:hypothetical protein CgunFtcFv8_010574 [Champsocephalus gunnari]
MSVPFSNTHLRVPRGFSTILEGLAREVLRDQPEDIPKYAAQYFDTLLTQREDSGIDPAEWAAKLEDRFYNNHAFKATGPSPEKEPSAKMTISKEKSYESQTEDESSHTEGVSNVSTTHPTLSAEPTIDEENSENEMDHENEDINEKAGGISEGEFHQNEGCEKDENSNDAEDETTDTDGGKQEDGLAEGYGDGEIQETNAGGAGSHSSQVTQENISTAGIEAERETLEASTHLPEEKEESRRTPVDSQLQDTVGETEVTSTEKGPDVMGLLEEEEVDSEIQEKRDTLCEEGSSSPTPSADLPAVEDEVPLASEKDSTEPEGKISEKDEDRCSHSFRLRCL